jgi:hypothetical protein
MEAAAPIVALRKERAGQGLDAGPATIARHLEHHHQVRVSPATISRQLARAGLVTPDPAKRPGLLPAVRSRAAQRVLAGQLHPTGRWSTGPAIVLTAFRDATAAYGAPASTLIDIQRHGLHHQTVRR